MSTRVLGVRRVPVADGAAYVPCSTKTIYRHVADGRLTGYRVGRKLLVDLDEIDMMIQPASSAARLEQHVRRALEDAPPLTEEQLRSIARLLTEAADATHGAAA